MRLTRIYQNRPLKCGKTISLTPEASNHLFLVLRLPVDARLILFNGEGSEYTAIISKIEKRKVFVRIDAFNKIERESPLSIHLAQAISRGEKMDFTIQKAVELGVCQITPILSERCGVKLSKERWQKRHDHWQKIIISACEQCGRNRLPKLNPMMNIDEYLAQENSAIRLVLDHRSEKSLRNLNKDIAHISLLIGPEGGLTTAEIASAIHHQFISIKLGPRILRTETAGCAIISALQTKYGDF